MLCLQFKMEQAVMMILKLQSRANDYLDMRVLKQCIFVCPSISPVHSNLVQRRSPFSSFETVLTIRTNTDKKTRNWGRSKEQKQQFISFRNYQPCVYQKKKTDESLTKYEIQCDISAEDVNLFNAPVSLLQTRYALMSNSY